MGNVDQMYHIHANSDFLNFPSLHSWQDILLQDYLKWLWLQVGCDWHGDQVLKQSNHRFTSACLNRPAINYPASHVG